MKKGTHENIGVPYMRTNRQLAGVTLVSTDVGKNAGRWKRLARQWVHPSDSACRQELVIESRVNEGNDFQYLDNALIGTLASHQVETAIEYW